MSTLSRRSFLAATVAAGAAAQDVKPVRIGMVGVGNRGTSLLRDLLSLPGVEVPAICDIKEANLTRALGLVEKARGKRPDGYQNGPEDYRRLVDRKDLDAVITATYWDTHTPISVAVMKAGKYAGVEVPTSQTVEECWQLVETSEKTGMPCMMLENVCYFRNVLLILNMVRQGVFGEIMHCEGAYQHLVRSFLPDGTLSWRGEYAARLNGNHYPTHPIGPIAMWANINHGDRFTYLTSMSSKSLGLNHQFAGKFGPDHPNAKRRYAQGDVNTSMIASENGVTITLNYDIQSPRPYDLGFKLQGTKGIYSGTLDKIYLEGIEPENWQAIEPYYEKYEHPLWKKHGRTAAGYGHSGGDYLTMLKFVEAVRQKTPPPIDVYDSVTWSAIVPLSMASVAAKSAPVDFPDFTRGKWKTAKPVEI